MKKEIIKTLLKTIFAIGFFDSFYLSYLSITKVKACGSPGCIDVLTSPFSSVGPISLSVIGMTVYLFLFLLLYKSTESTKKETLFLLSIITAIGSIISLFFIYLQVDVIKYWCPFCLVSSLVFFSSFLISFTQFRSLSVLNNSRKINWKSHLKVLVIAILSSFLIVLAINSNISQGNNKHKIAAIIGSRKISIETLDRKIGVALYSLEQKIYKKRKAQVDTMLLHLEAERQGVSQNVLIQNITKTVDETITEKEIKDFYNANKSLHNSKLSLFETRIRAYLSNQKKEALISAYTKTLHKKYDVDIQLEKPKPLTITTNPFSQFSTGPKQAKLTIIEFTDFDCHYCKDAHIKTKELLKQYPKDIHLITRHFPLQMHKGAKKKAAAAICANKQSKFSEYSDLLFSKQESVTEKDLLQYAKNIGLNKKEFINCIQSGDGLKSVEFDLELGKTLGISSTPSFFFNDEFMMGFPTDGQLKVILRDLGL